MKRVFFMLVSVCFMVAYVTPAQAWIFNKQKEKKETAPASTQESQAKKETAAQKEAGKTPAPKKAEEKKVAPQITPVEKKSIEAQRLLVQEKRKRFNNTEWQIELRALAGSSTAKEKDKKEADVLIFKDNQVLIESFAKKGFGATNYTLTVQSDGSSTWETMQSSEKAGLAFWRGEMDKDLTKMQGVLSYHVDEKTTRDYSFVSTAKADIQPERK